MHSAILWLLLVASSLALAQVIVLPTISASTEPEIVFGGPFSVSIVQNPGSAGTFNTLSLVIGVAPNVSAGGSVLYNGAFNRMESDAELVGTFRLTLLEASVAQVGSNGLTIFQTAVFELTPGDTSNYYDFLAVEFETPEH